MAAQDPALTRALEDLTTQVNPDNIMAVHKVFRDSSDELQWHLANFDQNDRVQRCGDDPVSKDAVIAFNGKIDEVLAVHRAHQTELAIAADHLKSIALSYGRTEQEITESLDPRFR